MDNWVKLSNWEEGAQDGSILKVEIHHAGRLNAMSCAMWDQLQSVFRTIAGQEGVRCVVVQGSGGNFCAGGDISEYPAFRFEKNALAHFHESRVWGGLQSMLDCPVPVIAAIEGACMGAGVEIAACCDLRLAKHDSKFGAPIAKLGFPMAPKELALVGKAVGNTLAKRMLLEAAVLSSEDMLRCGFLGQVFDEAAFVQAVQDTARKVAQLSPQAARLNKSTMRALESMKPEEIPDPYAYADSREHREGIDAFLQKRRAVF